MSLKSDQIVAALGKSFVDYFKRQIEPIVKAIRGERTRIDELDKRLRALEAGYSKALRYEGIWREGGYAKGSVVTRNGSIWHCQVDQTEAKPGMSGDWKMMTKYAGRTDEK